MKAGSDTSYPAPRTETVPTAAQQIESLQIRLKHIQNDYSLTKREYEAATIRYLDMLAEVNRQNRELEILKTQLEERVLERTAMLEVSNRALRESENRLQMVLSATSDGVWDRQLNTGEVYYSPSWSQMLGYAPDEIEPHVRAWDRILHPDDRPAAEKALRAHLDGQVGQFTVETRLRNKAGQWQWVLCRGKVVARDDAGRPTRLVGTNIDITVRKHAEDQMAHAAKMIALGTLVAGVAHEINNPNNFIMLGGPILQKYFIGIRAILDSRLAAEGDFMITNVKYSQMREDVPKLLEGVLEGARRIRDIVRDLREFARPDTADLDQSVDINQVLSTVVNLMQGVLCKTTSRFRTAYTEELPPISGNSHKLEQVFMSFLKNACEALTDKTQAIILASGYDPARRVVWARVRDEGVGIAPDIRCFIFDPFFTTKRELGSAGLGLTIATRIIEMHNAELLIDSAPGTGTTITVNFTIAVTNA